VSDANIQHEEDPNFESKVNKTDLMRVHVCTPAYDGKVDTDYAASMLMAGQIATTSMIEVSCSVMGNGAFIEMARNLFVHQFLHDEHLKDFTHLMFIDADLKFEGRGLAGLVRSGLPVTAGVYRRRQPVEDYPCKWTPLPGSTDKLWMNGGWLRCERVPTGFLCIERRVLEVMTERAKKVKLPEVKEPVAWMFSTGFDEGGRFMGEDFWWCDRYMELYEEGIFEEPIWVWPDLDFTHGGYECNYLHWLSSKVEERKQQDGKRRMGRRK
jgi:hypothetical protein